MRPFRRDMQMIFQDPYGSLNPRRRVGSIIGDPFDIHGVADGAERKKRVQELMEVVGLNPEHYNRFPAEFSGGQRQRIGVARALALRPKLIICDEPVSALDVSIQAQIINLLDDLQNEFGLTYIFIAHDLSVVRHVSRPGRGHVPRQDRGARPGRRPLRAAAPPLHQRAAVGGAGARPRPCRAARAHHPARRRAVAGQPAVAAAAFHPRCPKAQQICVEQMPPLEPRLRRPADAPHGLPLPGPGGRGHLAVHPGHRPVRHRPARRGGPVRRLDRQPREDAP